MSDPMGGIAGVRMPPERGWRGRRARLRATITSSGRTVTLRLDGELCGLSAPLLESVLHRLEARRPTLLILDLGGLTLIDLRGAGLVRRARERARLARCSLELVQPAGRP
jgi:anti-anti-sigma regulatory factor